MTKDELIEKYRYVNIEGCDWWQCLESQLKDDMRAIGFEVGTAQFSGFYSQGDGASFTGYMTDLDIFLRAVPDFEVACSTSVLLMKKYGFDCELNKGHYSRNDAHEYSVDIGFEICTPELDIDSINELADADPEEQMLYALLQSSYIERPDTWLLDFFRSKMCDYYHQLEEEYEYLTSDETILEWLEANDFLSEINDD